MGTAAVVFFILAALGGIIALTVRRVLRIPIAPPSAPTMRQTETLDDSSAAGIGAMPENALSASDMCVEAREIIKTVLSAPVGGQATHLGDALEKAAILGGLSFYFAFGPERKARLDQLPEMANAWWFGLTESLVRILRARPMNIDKSHVGLSANQSQPSDGEARQMLELARGPWMNLVLERRLTHEQAALACATACAYIIAGLVDKAHIDPHAACSVACRRFLHGTRVAQMHWASILASPGKGEVLDITGPSIKVRVFPSGEVEADGQNITLPQLDERLAAIKAANGIVMYYREPGADESPERELPAHVTQILDLVVKRGLPIALATKSDFSEFLKNGDAPST